MEKLGLDHETSLGRCPFLSNIFFFLVLFRKILTQKEMYLQCSNAGKGPCFCDRDICLNVTFPSPCRTVVDS